MVFDKNFVGDNGEGALIYGLSVADGRTPLLLNADASGSLILIGHSHSKVHQGDYYNASHYFSAVANAATAELYLKLSSSYHNHAVIAVGTSGDARLDFYENPTVAADGSSISIVNHNRTLALASPTAASSSTAFHTPTHSSPTVYGTSLIPGFVIPGGSKDKGGGAIAEASGEQWVLNAGSNYLIKVTNQSGSAQNISIDIAFYEVAA